MRPFFGIVVGKNRTPGNSLIHGFRLYTEGNRPNGRGSTGVTLYQIILDGGDLPFWSALTTLIDISGLGSG